MKNLDQELSGWFFHKLNVKEEHVMADFVHGVVPMYVCTHMCVEWHRKGQMLFSAYIQSFSLADVS